MNGHQVNCCVEKMLIKGTLPFVKSIQCANNGVTQMNHADVKNIKRKPRQDLTKVREGL